MTDWIGNTLRFRFNVMSFLFSHVMCKGFQTRVYQYIYIYIIICIYIYMSECSMMLICLYLYTDIEIVCGIV